MGDARATAALVAQGARVRPTWSAVHEAAAAGGDLEVLRLLVAHGLQLEARDVYGKSFAHHLPAVEVLQMLPRSGLEAVDSQGVTVGHEAAATGYPEVLEELHSRGYDPRAVDRRGRSVAQLAAENGHLEVLKQLLAWQAVPKLRKKHISNREVLDFLKTSEI